MLAGHECAFAFEIRVPARTLSSDPLASDMKRRVLNVRVRGAG